MVVTNKIILDVTETEMVVQSSLERHRTTTLEYSKTNEYIVQKELNYKIFYISNLVQQRELIQVKFDRA